MKREKKTKGFAPFAAVACFACVLAWALLGIAQLPDSAFAATDTNNNGTAAGTIASEASANPEEETDIEKAKRLIAALPADPDDITESHVAQIAEAQAAFDALSADEQQELDNELYRKSQSYGRWLESAQWGLLAGRAVNNSLAVLDGDYSTFVSSSSNMGKSKSDRTRVWEVTKLEVVGGKAYATVGCKDATSFKSLRAGGNIYLVSPSPLGGIEFQGVPVEVNGTTTFTVVAYSDAIAYQVKTSLPLVTATAGRVSEAVGEAESNLAADYSQYDEASQASIRQAAEALRDVASRDGVLTIELAAAEEVLAKAKKDAVLVPVSEPEKSDAASSASSDSADKSSASDNGSSTSNSGDNSGKSGNSSSKSGKSSSSSGKKSNESSSKSSASSDSTDKSGKSSNADDNSGNFDNGTDDGDAQGDGDDDGNGGGAASPDNGNTGDGADTSDSQGGNSGPAAAPTGGKNISVPTVGNANNPSGAAAGKSSSSAASGRGASTSSGSAAAAGTAGSKSSKNSSTGGSGGKASATGGAAGSNADGSAQDGFGALPVSLQNAQRVQLFSQVMIAAGVIALLLAGMCLRTFLFVRARDGA